MFFFLNKSFPRQLKGFSETVKIAPNERARN